MNSCSLAFSTFLLLGLLSPAASASDADEFASFLDIHKEASGQAKKKNWAKAAEAYGGFVSNHPKNAYAPVAAILQGIFLQCGLKKEEAARQAFNAALQTGATPQSDLVRAANLWLARLQLQALGKALHEYYVLNVEFPETLTDLVRNRKAKPEQLKDPWGKAFVYKPRALTIAPDVPRQAYSLRCASIEGDLENLDKTWQEALDFCAKYRFSAITAQKPYRAVLSLRGKPGKVVQATEGQRIGELKVLKVTRHAIVLVEKANVGVFTL